MNERLDAIKAIREVADIKSAAVIVDKFIAYGIHPNAIVNAMKAEKENVVTTNQKE